MNTLVEQNQGQLAPITDISNLMLNPAAMKHMMEVATFMSGGTLTLPEPYRKNPANCLAVVIQATQWRMSPFSVAQKTHFVNGTIGYEAQLVSAAIRASGATTGEFDLEWFGEWEKIIGKFIERESKTKKDDNGYPKKYKIPGWSIEDEKGLGIRVSATLRGEKKPRVLELQLMQANVRNSTLWADDPRQQLAYLAEKRWARLYAPGVILGVYSTDELETIERDVTPEPEVEKEPEFYTNDEFAKNKASWKEIVLTKKKSAANLIGFIESRGKTLTEAQKTEINSWKVIDQKPDDETDPQPAAGQPIDPFVAAMDAAETQGKE